MLNNLPVELVDEIVNGSVHVFVLGCRKNFSTVEVHGCFCFLIEFFNV